MDNNYFSSLEFYSIFPYIDSSIYYVKELNLSINDLIVSPTFENIRQLALSKILDCIKNNFIKPSFSNDVEMLTELLSYPYIKIILSCLNNLILIRKYAFSESKASIIFIKQSSDFTLNNLIEFSSYLNFHLKYNNVDHSFWIHFSDYIKYSIFFKDLSWKLANRNLINGYISITKEDLLRLIQEVIFHKIANSFTLKIPSNIYDLCFEHLNIINSFFQENSLKYKKEEPNIGKKINTNTLPECMNIAIKNVNEGINLSHSMRFTLVSFLNSIGINKKIILDLFHNSPDFNSIQSKYQIDHIISKNYKCPSCMKIKTYGNCKEQCINSKFERNPVSIYLMNNFK